MQHRRPQIIVRTAAMLTALVALGALAVLVIATTQLIIHRADWPKFYKELGVYGLFAIVPVMFIRASIQAWRFIPNGIASICSGWLLFGFMAGFVYLFHFFEHRRLEDGIGSFVSICAFLVGVLVGTQQKFFKTHIA